MGGGDKAGSGANDERTRGRKGSKAWTLGKRVPGRGQWLPVTEGGLEGRHDSSFPEQDVWGGRDREGLAQLLTHAVGTRHTAPAPAQLQVRVFCGWPSRGLRRPPTSTRRASSRGA